MKLDRLLDEYIDETTKGFPAGGKKKLRLRDIGAMGWNVLHGDVPYPVAVLSESALSHNSHWMRSLIGKFGAFISPHGKTTMAPQLFDRQLADGAWGITVATVQQLAVCCRFGGTRVLLANQVLGAADLRGIGRLAVEYADLDLYLLVDSIEGVERLATTAAEAGLRRPLKLLMEMGVRGGRTGCRDLDGAINLARAIHSQAGLLALHGVEGFEGILDGPDANAIERDVSDFLTLLADTARACAQAGLFAPGPVIVSAGGSAYFDLVLKQLSDLAIGRDVQLILRSGCYLTHDSRSFIPLFEEICRRMPEARAIGPGLTPALRVWTCVQSRPEAGLAIAAAGKRDLSYDVDLPIPELWHRPGEGEMPRPVPEGCRVTALNDQHAYIRVPDGFGLRVGDLIGFGISHPCTTFDKWRLLYVVDDEYRILEAVRTYF